MVLSWIVYALAVALLLTGAAAAAERWLRLTKGRYTRWAWLGAMLLSVCLPAAYLVSPALGGPPPPDVLSGQWMPAALTPPEGASGTTGTAAAFSPALSAWFPWLWAGVSASLLGWLAWSTMRLRRICSASPAWSAGGPRVHRTSRLGPGVVGVRRPRILVPDWVLEMDEVCREIVLLHEREHARCRDPVLLHVGWALLVVVPWLLPLWWQFRRLNLAVEMDCDRRVVDRVGDARSYGRVLLEAKRYTLGLGSPLVTAGGSFLERRVRRLVEGGVGRPGSRLGRAAAASAAALALAGAALLPPPEARAETGAASEEAATGGVPSASAPVDQALWDRIARGGPYEEMPTVLNTEEIRDALRARHPEELRRRGIGGMVHVALRVAEDGHVTGGFVTLGTGHTALDRAALEVAGRIRYTPARQGGEALPVWVVQRLRFRTE